MKLFLSSITLILLCQLKSQGQTYFTLEPSQAMLMTGKGPGQDGSINPYAGQICFAIIENTGKYDLSVRIQENGKLIETIPLKSKELIKKKLLKGYELYIDSNPKEKVEVKIDYESINKE